MRLSDLRDAKVRTLDGKMLGRIHEVHADGGRVVALICGAASLIERMTAKKHGRRIPWDCVVRLGKSEVVVSLEAPKPDDSRTRQGTRRPSGRQSTR